jgi:hypothetical protein
MVKGYLDFQAELAFAEFAGAQFTFTLDAQPKGILRASVSENGPSGGLGESPAANVIMGTFCALRSTPATIGTTLRLHAGNRHSARAEPFNKDFAPIDKFTPHNTESQ